MCKGCDGWGDYLTVQDFRHGKVEVEDFADEIPYRHAKRRKKKEKVRTRPGCPGNEYGPHVFVWTQERENEKTVFFRYYGFHKYQREVCVGCGKVRKVEHSERYVKRNERAWNKLTTPPKGEPVPWRGRYAGVRPSYFAFEQRDEGYMEFRKAWIDKHGWLTYNLDGRFLY